MINKQTTLGLNGPILSFTQQPQSLSVCNGQSATLVGIATAFFPTQVPNNPAVNDGTLGYRWNIEGYGPLTDGIFQGFTIVGSATTTLSLINLASPTNNGLRLYLDVDYVPSAYSQPVGSAVTAETTRSTANAINEILSSGIVIVNVSPSLSVAQQPSSQTVAQTRTATFNTLGSLTDISQGGISYRWQLNGSDLTDSSTVVGSSTPTLSISLPNISNNLVRARLTHPTSCDSPVFTNSVNFNVVASREIINYELVNDGDTSFSSGSQNIFDSAFTFFANPSISSRALVIYAPEKSIRTRITLAGASGVARGSVLGGEGGISVFEFTLKQNVEYTVKLGSTSFPTGGANGGGGAAFLYEKARLIAVCGGGGGAGTSNRGGFGGGIRLSGENGLGANSGVGGRFIATGQLPTTTGFDNSGFTGGQVSGCTIGNYWRTVGFTPCQDVGFVQWRDGDGRITTSSTASILRGYKPGTGFRNNGGDGSGNQGGGGAGAYGGNAAIANGSGGGGGSGYTDGSINIISTQLGGNKSTNSYITIELF